MNNNFKYKSIPPEKSINKFVESFWTLQNNDTDINTEGIILPDGHIDLIFSKTIDGKFSISLRGIETKAKKVSQTNSNSGAFVISFYLLSVEYLFKNSVADIVDGQRIIPVDFWGFEVNDLNNFEHFCTKATQIIESRLPKNIDERKLELFNHIYQNNGEIKIKDLAQQIGWSERQINRYFNQWFGISLKTYCNILRFRASFQHIKQGDLYPHHNYTDQSHFIKEVKRISGVTPKELNKNQKDRFLQFSLLSSNYLWKKIKRNE